MPDALDIVFLSDPRALRMHSAGDRRALASTVEAESIAGAGGWQDGFGSLACELRRAPHDVHTPSAGFFAASSARYVAAHSGGSRFPAKLIELYESNSLPHVAQ